MIATSHLLIPATPFYKTLSGKKIKENDITYVHLFISFEILVELPRRYEV
jgi:hypothetical protein